MERAVDNRLITYILSAGMVWMAVAVVYSLNAIEGLPDSVLWAMDNINDRAFELNLLIICSLCFTSVRVKLFCYATAFYVFFRGALEVSFILSDGDYSDVLWCVSGIYAAMVLLIFILLHNVKSTYERTAKYRR